MGLEPVTSVENAAVAHVHRTELLGLAVRRMSLTTLPRIEEDIVTAAERDDAATVSALSLEGGTSLDHPEGITDEVVLLDGSKRTVLKAFTLHEDLLVLITEHRSVFFVIETATRGTRDTRASAVVIRVETPDLLTERVDDSFAATFDATEGTYITFVVHLNLLLKRTKP